MKCRLISKEGTLIDGVCTMIPACTRPEDGMFHVDEEGAISAYQGPPDQDPDEELYYEGEVPDTIDGEELYQDSDGMQFKKSSLRMISQEEVERIWALDISIGQMRERLMMASQPLPQPKK